MKCAVANDSGAKERGRVDVVIAAGDRVGEVLSYECILRISAVFVPSCEPCRRTKVLQPFGTPLAGTAGVSQPGDPNPLTASKAVCASADLVDRADYLVPRHNPTGANWQVPLDEMQVGPTDPACAHPHPDLPCSWAGVGLFEEVERAGADLAGFFKCPSFHVPPSSAWTRLT